MSHYDFVIIDIRLSNLVGDDNHLAYKQVIPTSVLTSRNYNWLGQIIAIINDLEVKHV